MSEYDPWYQNQRSSQEKLILPAYQEDVASPSADAQTSYMQPGQWPSPAYRDPIRPEQLVRPRPGAPPDKPIAHFAQQVRTDPAYQILTVAIVIVLIASVALVVWAGTLLSSGPVQGSTAPQNGGKPATAQAGVAATATAQPTAILQPISTPIPSPTVAPIVTQAPSPSPVVGGPLTLSVVGLPQTVANGSVLSVAVMASQPNVSVRLLVSYSVPPYVYASAANTADANGNVMLKWRVRVIVFGNQADARVIAIARDQHGQQVQSQPVDVQIMK